MTYAFHPEAEEEFGEAVAYYEECETGLGLDFAAEVRATIQNILGYPSMWPALVPGVHRCLLHRFPYGVLYAVEDQGIRILAVMHLHRSPGYWMHRRQ